MIDAIDMLVHDRLGEASKHPRTEERGQGSYAPSVFDAKDIYRQIVRLTGPRSVQSNSSRIILHDVQEITGPRTSVWLEVEPILLKPIEDPLAQVEFERLANSIRKGVRESISRAIETGTAYQSEAMLRRIEDAVSGALEGIALARIAESRAASLEVSLSRAWSLDRSGRTDAALDIVYDCIDDAFKAGRFADVDLAIGKVRARDLSVDMLLGLLTATLPARTRLPSRSKLLDDVERTLCERGELDADLLVGL